MIWSMCGGGDSMDSCHKFNLLEDPIHIMDSHTRTNTMQNNMFILRYKLTATLKGYVTAGDQTLGKTFLLYPTVSQLSGLAAPISLAFCQASLWPKWVVCCGCFNGLFLGHSRFQCQTQFIAVVITSGIAAANKLEIRHA